MKQMNRGRRLRDGLHGARGPSLLPPARWIGPVVIAGLACAWAVLWYSGGGGNGSQARAFISAPTHVGPTLRLQIIHIR